MGRVVAVLEIARTVKESPITFIAKDFIFVWFEETEALETKKVIGKFDQTRARGAKEIFSRVCFFFRGINNATF